MAAPPIGKMVIEPAPSPEEVAAVMAALDAVLCTGAPAAPKTPRWRWSGRRWQWPASPTPPHSGRG